MKTTNSKEHIGIGLSCLTLAFLLFSISPSFSQSGNQTTRAVIIGISDYQSQEIPDLNYAHKDALAFSQFLQSKSGGSVNTENIKILTNEEATNARMGAALDWLLDEGEAGDQAIIYFSGHGDVETKTRRQFGFLLPWDSPPQSYMAGAYPLFYLEEIISTLTIDKNIKVLLVADACRSGKLAGSAAGGTQHTSANLAKKFGNEIKILSCQANEFSVEGERWGGGRGVFSYYLIDGLYGLADKNENYEVNLLEIGRYLEDNVSEDVAPESQIPLTIGARNELINYVDAELLDQIKRDRNLGIGQVIAARSPQSKEDMLAALNPKSKALYNDFQAKVEEKAKLKVIENLYGLITEDDNLASLLPTVKKEYSTALQDEVQQALNALLNSDPYESNKFFFDPANYHIYPEYIQRSIDLLEEDHYSIPSLKAKKLFFEGYNITRTLSESDEFDKPTRDSLRGVAGGYFDRAISLQPEASYLYYGKLFLYSHRTPSMIDSMLYYQGKANEFSPQWLLPYLSITNEYMYNLKDKKLGEEWLFKAQQLKPDSYIVLERLTWLYQTKGKDDEAMKVAKRMVELKPDLFNGYANVGCVYFQKRDYPEGKKWLAQAMELNSDPITVAPKYFAYMSIATKDIEKGSQIFQQNIDDERTPYWKKAQYQLWYGKALLNFANDPVKAEALINESLKRQHQEAGKVECLSYLAKAKIQQGKWDDANALLQNAVAYEPTYANCFIVVYSLLGEVEYQNGNIEKAEEYFLKGKDYPGDNLYKEEAIYRYANFLLAEGRDKEANDLYGVCNWITKKHGALGYYGEAKVKAKEGDLDLALFGLEKALDRYFPFKDEIYKEPLFEELRKTDKFKAIMQKHFPD